MTAKSAQKGYLVYKKRDKDAEDDPADGPTWDMFYTRVTGMFGVEDMKEDNEVRPTISELQRLLDSK